MRINHIYKYYIEFKIKNNSFIILILIVNSQHLLRKFGENIENPNKIRRVNVSTIIYQIKIGNRIHENAVRKKRVLFILMRSLKFLSYGFFLF